jgi:peptidyl-prolyl cis-trans isomerase SurA
VIAGLAIAAAFGADAGIADRLVAVVNDEVVTLSDVYEIGADYVSKKCPEMTEPCVTEAELEVLDSLLRRVLIRQELTKLELDVSAADVDQAIDATVRQYQLADRQALRAEVEASGKRWDKYREELEEFMRQQTFQGRVLAPRITVSDDEVQDFYQRTARNVRTPTAKISGIGIAIPPDATPEQEAEMVTQATLLAEALNKGEITWDDAVKLYNSLPPGMFEGQDFTPTSIIEPLAAVVFAAEPGVVQAPVRVETGAGAEVLFLVRVDDKGEKSEVAPFEEIEEELKDQLFREELEQAEEEWYQRARREAAIDVKLEVAS